MIVYVWLLLVTILIGMMAYQSYVDNKELEEMRAQQVRDIQHMYGFKNEFNEKIVNLTNGQEHLHDHVQRVESSVQDIKSKKSRRSKKS